MRTVIFGVDGLTFRILHPLIERGDLPNFQRLSQQGCEAVLESKYPPVTPAAWTSLSTGLKPAQHGVYDFWEYEEPREAGAARQSRVQTHRKGGKAIWNILSEYGKQVLVINVPLTYPTDTVNGIMVSGYMTPSTSVDFTYPTAFKEELLRTVPEYEIDVDLRSIFRGDVEEGKKRLVDAVLRMTERRMDLTMHLLKEKPWDFCYVAFVGADRLQHAIWEEIISLDTHATEYYRLLDHSLGLILEQLGPDDSLFVISDHGFQGVSTAFDINEFLLSVDLLKLSSDTQRSKSRRNANLKYRMKQLGLLSLARKTKRRLEASGIVKKYQGDVYHPLLTDIDWRSTLAYVPSQSGFLGGYADIFLDDSLDAQKVAQLRDALNRQVNPQTGKPLIDAIYSTEVFGSGPFAPLEPHLLLLPTDGITFDMKLGNTRFWGEMSRMRGAHQKDGVLYAYGGGIKRGFNAPDAEIYDLVPTVLRSMNLPLPGEFDGRILDEIFEPGGKQAHTSDAGDGSLARRKLKKLLEA
ncbi:MAG TPA: alkaline phosphatase family protein [Ktedonobacteraceae bacterium]|nr:alkaline phosphatase family protein [Ktedonobacteraceae bacterium]